MIIGTTSTFTGTLLGDLHMALGVGFVYLTTKIERPYTDWEFAESDCLVFGPETRGLPEQILKDNAERCLTIPMANRGPKPKPRDLGRYRALEALRQLRR